MRAHTGTTATPAPVSGVDSPGDAGGPETHRKLHKGIWGSLRVYHRLKLAGIPFPAQDKSASAGEAATSEVASQATGFSGQQEGSSRPQ